AGYPRPRRREPAVPRLLLPLALLACQTTPDPFVAGDDTDAVDTDPGVGAERCTSDLVLVLPTGERLPIPCEAATLTAALEVDPDDAPEVRSAQLVIDGAGSAGFECAVTLALQGLCGPGTYDLGQSVLAKVQTWDCAGVPDDWEGELVARGGTLSLTTVNASADPGNVVGLSVPVRLEGSASIDLPRGARLEGTFDVRRDVVAEDAEEQTCEPPAPVLDVDPITGGELVGAASGGGQSANWRYALTPSGPELPSVCEGCDRAAVLRLGPVQGTPPFDQSGQTTAFGVRTATGDALQLNREGQWEAWGHGAVNATGWSGTRTFSAGGRSGNENLTLTW
ncbi:MAG TPA: hypothetical protein PKA64_20140, partial [Myxococcota bacterium]|nr:hypothetical protein [Myxococcota bacterium]